MTHEAGRRSRQEYGARTTHPESTEASRARVIHHTRRTVKVLARGERILSLLVCTFAGGYLAANVLAAVIGWRATAGVFILTAAIAAIVHASRRA